MIILTYKPKQVQMSPCPPSFQVETFSDDAEDVARSRAKRATLEGATHVYLSRAFERVQLTQVVETERIGAERA